MQNVKCRMQNVKCKMQNAKCKMQNAECRMQNAKCKMQNAECKMQNYVVVNEMDNPIKDKSFEFAVRIVNLNKYLCSEKNEYVLSNQLLRSGTSIGANISEAERGQSKKDFISKMSIALKEANETEYWLRLLYRTNYLTQEQFDSLHKDIEEIIFILISICRTSNTNIK